MRRAHFEALRPVCSVCRITTGALHALQLATVERESGDTVFDGVLSCSEPSCQREYPIVDGIPILVPAIRKYLAEQAYALLLRDDVPPVTASVLWDAIGPGSYPDALRQQLSSYTWDHWGGYDTDGTARDTAPGSVARVLDRAIALGGEISRGNVLDAGCAVGRTSVEMAGRTDGLVLGVDTHLAMLRVAQRMLHTGSVTYDRRRVGMVYDRRTVSVPTDSLARVDYWACDALALPFADATFATTVALNVLDCVTSPRDLLVHLRAVTRTGGTVLLATPYDWSPNVTPVESWLGGHSQRGVNAGASEAVLAQLLTPDGYLTVPGLERIADDPDVPWDVRLHARSTMRYRTHVVAARAI